MSFLEHVLLMKLILCSSTLLYNIQTHHTLLLHPDVVVTVEYNWFKEQREKSYNTKQFLYFFLGIQWVDIRKGNDAISPVLVVSFYFTYFYALHIVLLLYVCPTYMYLYWLLVATHICCMCFAILESFFTPRLLVVLPVYSSYTDDPHTVLLLLHPPT